MKKIQSIIAMMLCGIFMAACEDTPPNDYTPENVVEAVLIVGQPIEGIKVYVSQPVIDTFRYENSIVKNADVKIIGDGKMLQLSYRDAKPGGEYFYSDTMYKVQPNTQYSIEVNVGGKKFTGETKTPAQIAWVRQMRDTVYFPKDTIKLESPDSLRIEWTATPGVEEAYLASALCLDTLEYGKYLTPPTSEKNRRITATNNEADPRYNETARYGYVVGTKAPFFWYAYKWYGLHEYSMYAPDINYLNWMKLTRVFGSNPQYDPNQGSIYVETGSGRRKAFGVFGSASVVRQRVFLMKNQQ